MSKPINPDNVMTWPHYGDMERRGDAGATFGGFDTNGLCCGAKAELKLCTRDKGHPDPHIAHACVVDGRFDVMEVVKVWPL